MHKNHIIEAFLVATLLVGGAFINRHVTIGAGVPFISGSGSTDKSFAGPITSVLQCTCSGGAVVIIGPPAGGRFLFKPGTSKIRPLGQIFKTGPLVIGSAKSGGGRCSAGGSCGTHYGVDGVIKEIGSSE